MSVAGFKLTLWIPVEQVGIVIGRSGQTINKIQGGTSSRLNVVPDQDASAWAPVYIRGAPDGVFAAVSGSWVHVTHSAGTNAHHQPHMFMMCLICPHVSVGGGQLSLSSSRARARMFWY